MLDIVLILKGEILSWSPIRVKGYFIFLIGMFDHDNSGAIEFNEFQALWQYVTDWQRTFRSYDQDNSGTIDREELKTGKVTLPNNLECK